jgi:hypothetical protein
VVFVWLWGSSDRQGASSVVLPSSSSSGRMWFKNMVLLQRKYDVHLHMKYKLVKLGLKTWAYTPLKMLV